MSGHAPPDGPLEEARRALTRRGYLRSALPAAPERRWKSFLRIGLFAVALAAAVATGAVGSGHVSWTRGLVLWLGLLPATLCVVFAGMVLGRLAASLLLRFGAEPARVALGLGVIAALGVLAVLWASRQSLATPSGALPGLLAGGVLAAVALLGVRRTLLSALSLPPPSRPTRDATLSVLAAVLVVGIVGLATLAWRAGVGPPAREVESLPPPQGRVAVVAVDGLCRDEFDAAAALLGPQVLGRATSWGWARLDPPVTTLPAVGWTTLACGVAPHQHGVDVVEEVRLFGTEQGIPLSPITRAAVVAFWQPLGLARVVARPALERRAPTFWEMAARAGCPVTVGGWWGSWPVRRVLGEVASERAWLGGGSGEDAVTPSLAPMVRRAWSNSGGISTVTSNLAGLLAKRAAGEAGTHVVALAFPALDIERRSLPGAPPLVVTARQEPHLVTLGALLVTLEEAGFTVYLVAIPWHGGVPFIACSAAPPGEHPKLGAHELVATVLDHLGLPAPLGVPAPRRDLSGVSGPQLPAAFYGGPPPPLAAPSAADRQTQRELLRNLGYLR